MFDRPRRSRKSTAGISAIAKQQRDDTQLMTCHASRNTQTASATPRTVAAMTSRVRGRTSISRDGARSTISARVRGRGGGRPLYRGLLGHACAAYPFGRSGETRASSTRRRFWRSRAAALPAGAAARGRRRRAGAPHPLPRGRAGGRAAPPRPRASQAVVRRGPRPAGGAAAGGAAHAGVRAPARRARPLRRRAGARDGGRRPPERRATGPRAGGRPSGARRLVAARPRPLRRRGRRRARCPPLAMSPAPGEAFFGPVVARAPAGRDGRDAHGRRRLRGDRAGARRARALRGQRRPRPARPADRVHARAQGVRVLAARRRRAAAGVARCGAAAAPRADQALATRSARALASGPRFRAAWVHDLTDGRSADAGSDLASRPPRR